MTTGRRAETVAPYDVPDRVVHASSDRSHNVTRLIVLWAGEADRLPLTRGGSVGGEPAEADVDVAYDTQEVIHGFETADRDRIRRQLRSRIDQNTHVE